jgi:hypothetical protein
MDEDAASAAVPPLAPLLSDNPFRSPGDTASLPDDLFGLPGVLDCLQRLQGHIDRWELADLLLATLPPLRFRDLRVNGAAVGERFLCALNALLATIAFLGSDPLLHVCLMGAFWELGASSFRMRWVLRDDLTAFRPLPAYPVLERSLTAWWKHHKGCDGDIVRFHTALPFRASEDFDLAAFARLGDLQFLQRVASKTPRVPECSCCVAAAESGHLTVLQWLRQHPTMRHRVRCMEQVACAAAQYGHVAVLEWVVQTPKFEFTQSMCTSAARGGQLDALQWLRVKGCPWDENTTATAAQYGHLDLLEWAYHRGCVCSSKVMDRAAASGHLPIVQWGCQHFLRSYLRMPIMVARHGHLEVLQWMYTNRRGGRPWEDLNGWPLKFDMRSEALQNGHTAVVEWLDSLPA